MTADLWPYFGELGRMVQVPFTASEGVAREARYVTRIMIDGRKRAQLLPASPRSWTVDVPLGMSSELAPIEAFLWGAWGPGPWAWVSVAAQVGNVLTPEEALMIDRVSNSALSDAGPVRAADGSWAGRSVAVALGSGWVSVVRGIPVIAGKPVTWAMDVQGAGSAPQVQLTFYDSAGGTLTTHAGSGTGTDMQRVSVSAVAPAGAVEARAGVRHTTVRAARPQATWTDGPVPYAPGHGCRSAIIDGLSSSLVVAGPDGPVSKLGFTVQEVA